MIFTPPPPAHEILDPLLIVTDGEKSYWKKYSPPLVSMSPPLRKILATALDCFFILLSWFSFEMLKNPSFEWDIYLQINSREARKKFECFLIFLSGFAWKYSENYKISVEILPKGGMLEGAKKVRRMVDMVISSRKNIFC